MYYEYQDNIPITVYARYQLNYDTQGGSYVTPTYTDESTESATLAVTGAQPTKSGYTFKGWSETSDGKTPAAGSYTLNWSTGLGGKNNPVSKTLYAIWEEAETYTVTYTDGVPGKTVFPDQGYEGLKEGDATPKFEGTPTRENYTFMGWAPAVKALVSAADANDKGEIIYTATWQKKQEPTTDYSKVTITKTHDKNTVTVGDEIKYTITLHNASNVDVVVKSVTDTLPDGVDFSAVSKNDGGVYDAATRTVTWNNITVPANGSKDLNLWVTATKAGTVKNEAQVTLPDDTTKGGNDGSGVTVNPKSTTYTVYHEYFTNDQRTGATKGDTINGTVGQVVQVSDLAKNTTYQSDTYGYTRAYKGETANNPDGYKVVGNAITELTLAESGNIIVLRYDRKTTPPVTNPKLEKLEKERLTAAPAGVTLDLKGKTVNYDQNVVFVGDNAPAVTLLYKITVTGTEGAKYEVIDNGATHVGGDPLIGTIAEGKTQAVIYVTMDFTKANITADGKLVNNATLKSNDPVTPENPGGTEGPTNGGATGEAGAKKQYNVTINFKTEGGAVLQDPSKTTVDEGADFNYSLESANARKARANSDVTAVVIPQRLGANNEYVLDMVASAAGLKKLAEAKNITADVVADIIYSLDEKGTTGTDSEGKPTDTFDGIPDKYQVKVTFKVVHGKWNDETTADVVKYVVKYAADGVTMDKNGTATLGNIIPAVGGKPDDGFTTGSWDTEPSAETKIKADAAYVYTYAKKTTPIENIKARYLVQWLNEDGEVLKSEIRGPEAIGTVVTVKDEDKAYEGYTFNAENTNNVLEGTLSKTEAVILKLYFTKNPVEHTVTFDSNGGSDVAEQKVKHNELANRPADPTRDGYTFNGWTLNGQPYDFTTPVTGNITLVAQWTQNSRPVDPDPDYTYTLNYNANGGVGAPASQSQINSRNFTVSAVEPTREGYTFAGWATTAGAETAAYQPGSQLRINNGFSLTLFAVWTPEEDVNETEPPLVETPDVTETPDEGEDLGDNDTPLTELPDETEPPVEPTETPDETEDLDEGDTPLAEVPQTGDSIGLWIVLTLCSAAGLYCFFPKKKKGQRES